MHPAARDPAVADKERYVHTLFDALSARYDLFNRLASLGMDQGWRRRAIQAAGLRPGWRVLDVGAGTGDLTLLAAAAVAPTGIAAALDLSEPMLQRAQAKADGVPPGYHVRTLAARAEQVPLPDRAVEAVISGFVMRNVSDLGKTLLEAHRVLRPAGRVVILEFGRPRFWVMRIGHMLWLTCGAALLGWLVTGARWPFSYLRRSIAGFLKPAEFMAALRAAGFTDVTATGWMGGAVMLYRGVKAS